MDKITFKPLKNAVPEGTAEGDEFDLVCTFRLESDGRVCVTQMGDVKAEYDEKAKYRPDFKGDAREIQASMMSGEVGTGDT